MADIPTIPGSAQVQTQAIGVKRDPTMAIRAGNAAREAFSSAAGAIEQGMSVIEEYELRKRKAEEAYTFNASSLSFQKMHTDFLHNVKKQPDDQIVPNWTAATQQWKQDQLDQYGKKLSPRAMKVFQMNMDNAIGGSTAKFQVVADQLGSQRREGAAVANWNEFLKTGDPGMAAKAEGALRLAVNAGDMTQAKMDFYTSQIKPTLQKNQILNGIDNDAFATLQGIKAGHYPDVPEAELNTLRNAAEKQVNFVQRTTGMDLTNAFAMTHVAKTDDELKDLKKSGQVTGEFVKSYKDMVARKDHAEASDKQALMLNKLRDLDLSDSDNPEKDVREVTDEAASLPPQMQKEIHTLADQRIKSAQKAQRNEMHADQLYLMRQSYDESVGKIPISPRSKDGFDPAKWAESPEAIRDMPDEQFDATFGKDADRDSLVKQATRYVRSENLRYAKAQKSFIEWTKTKKGMEATPQAAADERERLGFGRYSSTADVAASFKAGKIDATTAKEILHRQFGIP